MAFIAYNANPNAIRPAFPARRVTSHGETVCAIRIGVTLAYAHAVMAGADGISRRVR